MKAIIYDKSSSPDRLVYREVAKPRPQKHQVLIWVMAVSVNAADYRSMQLGIIPKSRILGADISGVVEEIGTDVSTFTVGDEVFGNLSGCGSGGFAEYVAAPENVLAHKPAAVSFENAAAVPMAALTALQGLRDIGNIQPGQKVLIYGAGGGVGTFAVQLALNFGAAVTAVCGIHNQALMQTLGVERVMDYTKEDFAANGDHFDLILAVNGNRPLRTFKRALVPGGIYVMVGGTYSQVARSLIFGPIMSIGDKKMRCLTAKPNVEDLKYIINLVEEGRITPIIDKRYPLHETAEAVRYLTRGHARGKVIINISQA